MRAGFHLRSARLRCLCSALYSERFTLCLPWVTGWRDSNVLYRRRRLRSMKIEQLGVAIFPNQIIFRTFFLPLKHSLYNCGLMSLVFICFKPTKMHRKGQKDKRLVIFLLASCIHFPAVPSYMVICQAAYKISWRNEPTPLRTSNTALMLTQRETNH